VAINVETRKMAWYYQTAQKMMPTHQWSEYFWELIFSLWIMHACGVVGQWRTTQRPQPHRRRFEPRRRNRTAHNEWQHKRLRDIPPQRGRATGEPQR
jgi:hypothetical protein